MKRNMNSNEEKLEEIIRMCNIIKDKERESRLYHSNKFSPNFRRGLVYTKVIKLLELGIL